MKRSAPKNTPQMRDAICRLVKAGLSVNRAAGKVRLHHSTVAEWRKNDATFNEAVEQAEASFIERQVKTIEKAAEKGSWQAAAWLIERKHPAEFAQPQFQLNMPGAKVQFEDLGDWLEKMQTPEAVRAFVQLGHMFEDLPQLQVVETDDHVTVPPSQAAA